MHICFITNEYPKLDFPHGGVGTFVHTISHKLVEKGHKVSVVGINVYTQVDEIEKDDQVTIYRLKPQVLRGLTWFLNTKSINLKLKEINKNSPIDIIETAELGLAFIKKIKPIKYVIRLHGGHHFFAESENRQVSPWKGFQEKLSFKKADAFIAVSKFVKSYTAQHLSYQNKPLKIIRYPINLEIFKPKTEIEIEPNTILFAGTVCEKKGINQLLMAMPNVIEQNKDVQLYIYGRDWFFPNGKSYIEFLKEHILPKLGSASQHIHFKGAVPLEVLATKYAAAEVCIFPSLMETQGLVAPEAMAMEKLVIFSKCGPGPETIEHQFSGLLCDPYDDADIANQITWALKHKEESKTISKNAKASVLRNFEINVITNENLNFYNTLIN